MVDGYIENLENDKQSLELYYNKLLILKKRGFKVANAIARLKFQIEITQTSITNLSSQKKQRLILLKNDILELTKTVLDYRIAIYDNIDDKILIPDLMKIVNISLSHISDLQEDVYKFDPQVLEAQQYKDRNFDVGDLVETLELQKTTTQDKHTMYAGFFVNISKKHYVRTVKYLNEIAETAERVKNDAEYLKMKRMNNQIQTL